MSLPHNGFTLIELMISIAIALVLILGINEVFKIAARTVGAGQAMSAINSDNRVAHFTVETDIKNALTQGSPAFIISSTQQFAFRNADDQASASDATKPWQIDLPGANGTTTPTTVDASVVSERSHRLDLLSFFASGDLYARQTANGAVGNAPSQYVSPTTSNEAYIWYGHGIQPDNSATGAAGKMSPGGNFGSYFAPGDKTKDLNPNNFYASDWILGRMAMLMVPVPPNGDNFITGNGPSKNPLANDATSTDTTPWSIFQSRYDLVNTSITAYRSSGVATGANVQAALANRALMTNWRFWTNPFVQKPISADGMAGAAPIFLRHCTQFIVEYAGDFCTQDNNPASPTYGNIVQTSDQAKSDGVLDFVVQNGRRQVRWYGFPRALNGNGAANPATDVVPLYDFRYSQQAVGANAVPANFEYELPTGWKNVTGAGPPPNPTGPGGAYAFGAAPSVYAGNLSASNKYTCSWGQETPEPLPQMLRITFTLDDPNGRLASGQTFEYVIDLQH